MDKNLNFTYIYFLQLLVVVTNNITGNGIGGNQPTNLGGLVSKREAESDDEVGWSFVIPLLIAF